MEKDEKALEAGPSRANDVVEADDVGVAAAEGGPTQVAHSLYPTPPSVFARFTRDNVARLQCLTEAKERDQRTGAFDWVHANPQQRIARQQVILEEAAVKRREEGVRKEEADQGGQNDEAEEGDEKREKQRSIPPDLLPAPDWDVLLAMESPNVGWIEEDGHYTCFGEQWPVEETLPSLEQVGMPQLYPHSVVGQSGTESVAADERPAILTTLLRTMLKSYLGLIDIVLAPPHEYLAAEQDPATGQTISQQWRFTSHDKAREINDITINFMHLLNETRPLQAREQLRDLLRDQLLRRREEAKLMRLCVELQLCVCQQYPMSNLDIFLCPTDNALPCVKRSK